MALSGYFLDMDNEEEENVKKLPKKIEINRCVYNDATFAEKYLKKKESKANSKFPSCTKKCSGKKMWAFICSILPVLTWLPKYQMKKDLVRDIAGGLTVGIMQVPQGMAYAMLTTLPPIYGLYVSFVPVLVYFLFGTSRHVSVGTFAIVCLMSGEAVRQMVQDYQPTMPLQQGQTNASASGNGTFPASSELEQYKVQVAVSLAFSVGVVQLFLGIIRMGFLTVYLSDPLISGFTTGAAFHILSSQVRHFLGLTVPSGTTSGVFSLFKLYIYFFKNISDVNVSSLVIGIICSLLLFFLKYLNQRYKFKFPIPCELIVVVLGAGISYGANFNGRFGTPILKHIPGGLPPVSTPSISLMTKVATQAVTIACVAFAINISLVKSFAKKNNYTTSSNQELIAYGITNMVSSFFSCFPSSCSLSRSLIQENLGSTQLTGLISVVLVVLVLVSMAPLFQPLPNAVLAAIVLVALKGLFKQFSVLKILWKISKIDAFIWFLSFLGVFCLGVDYGLIVGIVITLLSVVGRTSRPSYAVLGRIPDTEMYKSVSRYNVIEVPHTKIFQYKSSLYYANVEHFLEVLSESLHAESQDDSNMKSFSTNAFESSEIYINADAIDNKNSIKLTGFKDNKMKDEENNVDVTIRSRRSNSLPPSSKFSAHNPEPKEEQEVDTGEIRNLVLDCSHFGFIDSMAVTALVNVVNDQKKSNIAVYLANCSENVLHMLDVGGFIEMHGRHRIFLTVHDAVLYCEYNKPPREQVKSTSTDSTETFYEIESPDVADSSLERKISVISSK
eukprot:gene7107-7911_t